MALLSDTFETLTTRKVVLHCFFVAPDASSTNPFKSQGGENHENIPKNFLVAQKYRRTTELQYMLVTWEYSQ
jgi:hypothetical protein